MTFAELLDAYPQAPTAEIDALLQIKANEKEGYHHLLSPHLRVWTERLVQLVSQYSVEKSEPIDFEILNQFFLHTIRRIYANH
ncbi:Uncharacterised protein [Suttonella ornithocola]|uniref:Uncharacterized protein n=1 Tax=Suttonella ornithocola TaxID=279832 RepID=A0A380MTK5_9GAMM|nr:Uncharacterised protein [Suttonella ornithocola]